MPSVHAAIATAPRRTASSGSRASCPQAAARSGGPPGPMSASCTPVCSQSARLSSASATARAISRTAAAVPTRARDSAVRRVTAVSSASSSSSNSAPAASGTSVKAARSSPARQRRLQEGDDASSKAVSKRLVISGTTRQSHAPKKIESLAHRLTKYIALTALSPLPSPSHPATTFSQRPEAEEVTERPEHVQPSTTYVGRGLSSDATKPKMYGHDT